MMEMLNRSWICAAMMVMLCHAAAGKPQESLSIIGTRRQFGVAAEQPSKLSAALRAIADSEGILKGVDENAHFIMSTPSTKLSALRSSVAVAFVTAPIPRNWTPVKRLVLSYDPTNKPSQEDLKKTGLNLIEDYEKGSFMIVQPIGNQIDAKLVKAIQAESRFQYAAPEISIKAIPPSNLVASQAESSVISASNQPNDPLFKDLWGMQSIRAPIAWSTIHDSNVIVAVIDTGVDYNHEDLKDNMWTDSNGKHGYNFVDNNDDPMDLAGHGTHCAGTIGAVGNNGIGVVGVDWRVRIMAVRWLDAGGSGDVVNAIKAIDFAVDHGAKVLSNSWYWYEDEPNLAAAIKRAMDSKVLFVAAAGNFAKRPNNNQGNNDKASTFGRFPSSYQFGNIIAVAAIDQAENLADFSEWGKITVHLGAPGVLIESSVPKNGYDGTYSGTSMATPHVAGAAALIMGSDPSIGYAEAKALILKNVRKIPSLKDRCVSEGTLDISFLGHAPVVP